jgi:signal peptidase I
MLIFFVAQAFIIPSGSMISTLRIGDMLFAKKFSYGIPTPRLPWVEVPVLPDFNDNGHLIEGDRPQRGDIVIFRYPKNDKIHYVKRCVATEGDEIIYYPNKLFIRFSEGDEYMKKNYSEQLITLNGKLYVENPYMINHKGIAYGRGGNDSFLAMLQLLSVNEVSMTPHRVEELPSIMGKMAFNSFYHKVEKDKFFMVGDNRDNSNDSRFWGSVPYKDVVGKPWFIYFSWDENYEIRWNRIFRTVESLEEELKN